MKKFTLIELLVVIAIIIIPFGYFWGNNIAHLLINSI